MTPKCVVAKCESSGHTQIDLTANDPTQGWAHLPAPVWVCNHHKGELENPETEWMLDRDNGLYVGDTLRELNEYVLVEPPNKVVGYASGRVFSHGETEDGYHIPLRVRRRGDKPKDIVLVVTSREIADGVKSLGRKLP